MYLQHISPKNNKSYILHMLDQTHKTFIDLQNKKKKIFNETGEFSIPLFNVHTTQTLTLQKMYKDIENEIYRNQAV